VLAPDLGRPARAEVNHGYLSLLERGEVTEPAPSMLHKLARGHDLPFIVLMRWVGYVEADEKDLTQNQAIALSYLGDDMSDDELAAVKAVLDAIRSKGAAPGFAADSLDRELTAQRTAEIRQQVMRLLNSRLPRRHPDPAGSGDRNIPPCRRRRGHP
jgi:hypothetical protein